MINNTILITGASSGVGASLVQYFSKKMKVVAIARRIDKMEKEFESNANVHCYKCDLGDTESIRSVIDLIKETHGFIGHVINNAGVKKVGFLIDLNVEDFKMSLDVNFIAPSLIMKLLLPEMIENNFGRIVNVTSGAPLNNFQGFGAYSASKGALNSITITVANELSEKNIKINLMSPGAVKSEMSPQMDVDPAICHPTADYLINLGEEGRSGEFYWLGHKVPMFSDLSDTEWLEGKPGKNMIKILE